ncbi:hypothetical protein [Ralstonia pseudosolanacearum]|uniref:hypothetical protein n=1 Tax=Ralstonia pseudosolanacearum TaxID=1310165 RepID=UPI003CF546FD
MRTPPSNALLERCDHATRHVAHSRVGSRSAIRQPGLDAFVPPAQFRNVAPYLRRLSRASGRLQQGRIPLQPGQPILKKNLLYAHHCLCLKTTQFGLG